MKKIAFVLLMSVILLGCTPSDAQIEEAIEQTKVAQPTNTDIPEPTNTPIIEPSSTAQPTSNIESLQDLTNENVVNIFEDVGADCGVQVKEDDGSYTQECGGTISDGMIMGQVNGQSEDTVFAFFMMFVQFVDKDIQGEAEDAFLNLTNFGPHSDEMQSWITENLSAILSSDEELEYTTEIAGTIIRLSGYEEVITLLIMSNQ